MATLTRIQNLISSRRTSPIPAPAILDTDIPAPFPSLSDRHADTGEIIATESQVEPTRSNSPPLAPTLTVELVEPSRPTDALPRDPEVLPSLLSVEQSCLMALNNLFADIISSETWRPIVPPRRHSLPSLAASTSHALPSLDSAPLYTLVSNLRSQDAGDLMIEASDDDVSLLRELGQRIELYSELMGEKDARLARLLVTLLQVSSRLSAMSPASSSLSPPGLASSISQPLAVQDVYDTLSRQASSIQLQLHGSMPGRAKNASVSAVDQAMLWAQVDRVLGDIQTLCHDRTLPTPFLSPYHFEDYDRNLPPEYDQGDYHPPTYETSSDPYLDLATEKEKTSDAQSLRRGALSHRESIVSSEKMKLDLDSVMMAIDRLYIVAPQLSNQRVELKRGKLEQMELARVAGAIEKLVDSGRLDDQRAVHRPTTSQIKGKQRLNDKQDLDKLMSMIGQAASRTLDSQTVFVDNMQARLERAKQKDDAKRDAFVTQLVQHSSHGRLHSQDATLRPPIKGREIYPSALHSGLDDQDHPSYDLEADVDVSDPNAMMTLPEFVKFHPGPTHKSPSPPGPLQPGSPRLLKKPSKLSLQGRNRSNSAPPLAWLTGKSATPRSPLVSQVPLPNVRMNVTYVAELRENLQLVAAHLRVDGMPRSSRLEANVVPGLNQSDLVLQCGSTVLSPLPLPAWVPAGKADLFAASLGKPTGATEYLDLKLCTALGEVKGESDHDLPPLLDSEQLRSCQPSSFACVSCSLPVVHGLASGNIRYNDLPSDYWAELLDAWMCHPDQHVSAEIAKRADGFWPESGQVLVGSSFLLFDSSMVNRNGLVDTPTQSDREWRRVQCLCGASIGHRQEREGNTMYRFKKYTVRPITATQRFSRIPFTAFVAADMADLAQAHASYRFVIQDEEDEAPRVLIWLFKPSIQLSYAGAAGSWIPSSGTITAAKVTFVIFGPGESANSLERYPAFARAETLSYPMDLCRRLAASLKESNAVYPEARRTLDGMSIGWLQRL
ncbi:hypothetical protein BDV93DRAFT_528705 [Ceratobasidium sp. AG-I]|nr:hypothetical protein BDV93DRAFT_528705 [Ceratobasidium sp. AG-I]